MIFFFTSLNCIGCKDKTIFKIYNGGYQTIEDVIKATPENFKQIDGIGNVLATKLCDSINNQVKIATTKELLSALNSFGEGIGLKKLKNLNLKYFLNVVQNNQTYTEKVKGISNTTLNTKILPVLIEALERVRKIKALVDQDLELEEEMDCLENIETFVFTGFRDTSLEKQIFNCGNRVTSAISKKTTYLVVDSISTKKSTKVVKAENLGIKIITKKELLQRVFSEVKTGVKEYLDPSEED